LPRPRSDHLRAGHDAHPVPPPGSVTQAPPESLGAVGASVWKAIVKQGGPSMDGDALALERYCQLHDRRAVLLALVDDEGYIAPGSKKQPTAHPAIQLAHDIERQMTALEAVLALNPETDHDSSPPVSGQYQPLACQKALARAAVP
jgi:P27 family predicted phage terminase small subunit